MDDIGILSEKIDMMMDKIDTMMEHIGCKQVSEKDFMGMSEDEKDTYQEESMKNKMKEQ